MITHISGRFKRVVGKWLQNEQGERCNGLPHRLQATQQHVLLVQVDPEAQLAPEEPNTIGRWLRQYADGGLPALSAVYNPAGKRPALSPHQLAQLQRRLAQPEGFGS